MEQRQLSAMFFCDSVADARTLGFTSIADVQHHVAQKYCQGCPSRMVCFLGAIERKEPAGIWGGVSFPDGYKALQRAVRAEWPKTADVPVVLSGRVA